MMLEFCPLCDKNGFKRNVVLSQINLDEAVWLCESQECPWPFGYKDFTFVSRKIGEMWSSEWETRKPLVLRSPDTFPTSLNELGLDTPPVTPGSGYEIAQKDSVLSETLCSSTSLNLGTNNLARTKSNLQSLSNVKKCRLSNSRECAGVGGKSDEIIIEEEVSRKRVSESQEFSSDGVSNGPVNKKKKLSKLISSYSLSDNSSLESLDNRLSSSEEFIDPSSTAEASTESVFDVEKTGQKSLFSDTVEGRKALGNLFVNPNDESTVKCTKWLSDNKKNAICTDHSYLFNQSSNVKIIYKPGIASPLQIPALSPKSDNSGGVKRLLRIKSIERANIKVVVGSRKDSQADSGDAVKISTGTIEEKLIPANTRNPSEIVDSKIMPDNCSTAWENNSGTLRTESRTVLIDGLPPISLSYQIPSFIEEAVPPSGNEGDQNKEGDVKIEPGATPGENKFGVANNLEVISTPSATNGETELKKQSMKKPLKRTIHKATKYQGFNFGALKKKSKSNASRNEESNKTSIPNLPSPDNVSTCSDLTYTSETSCATTATGTSRSESVSSTMDSSSKSMLGMDNFSSTTTSSDQKSRSTFSTENNDTVESSLNLDSVLDELLFEANDSLPQNLGDDWLTSLFD